MRFVTSFENNSIAPGLCGCTVRELAKALSLKVWKPEENVVTYPSRGTRLDWILISKELQFRSHGVLPDELSDHRAVVAEIGLR